jgi:hypothetical protein
LRLGKSKSCGCRAYIKKTHGFSRGLEYSVWRSMIARYTDPKSISYKYYGARGVRVCQQWMTFENFYADMAPRLPGLTLDRIDPRGNYEKANCRWATYQEQANNMRKHHRPLVEIKN